MIAMSGHIEPGKYLCGHDGIIMLGANGSGKSTLGRELAHVLHYAHFDVEDYWFYQTDIPYTAVRPQEERNEMLLSDMKKHGRTLYPVIFRAGMMIF